MYFKNKFVVAKHVFFSIDDTPQSNAYRLSMFVLYGIEGQERID